MSQTIRVYVPAYRDNSDFVTRVVENLLTREYGGATTYLDQRGVWEDPDGDLDQNPVNIVESVTVQADFDPDVIEEVLGYVRRSLDQQEVIATVSETDVFTSRA